MGRKVELESSSLFQRDFLQCNRSDQCGLCYFSLPMGLLCSVCLLWVYGLSMHKSQNKLLGITFPFKLLDKSILKPLWKPLHMLSRIAAIPWNRCSSFFFSFPCWRPGKLFKCIWQTTHWTGCCLGTNCRASVSFPDHLPQLLTYALNELGMG